MFNSFWQTVERLAKEEPAKKKRSWVRVVATGLVLIFCLAAITWSVWEPANGVLRDRSATITTIWSRGSGKDICGWTLSLPKRSKG